MVEMTIAEIVERAISTKASLGTPKRGVADGVSVTLVWGEVETATSTRMISEAEIGKRKRRAGIELGMSREEMIERCLAAGGRVEIRDSYDGTVLEDIRNA